jgi:N-acetylneuraminic acid mutarotase
MRPNKLLSMKLSNNFQVKDCYNTISKIQFVISLLFGHNLLWNRRETENNTQMKLFNLIVASVVLTVIIICSTLISFTINNSRSITSVKCSIELGEWFVIGRIPTARAEPSTARVNNKLFLASGKEKGDILLNGMDIYDAESNQWTTNLTVPFYGMHQLVTEYNGYLYFIGGSKGKIPRLPAERNLTGLSSDHARKFDPITRTWHSLPNMPGSRAAGVTFVDRFGIMHYIGGLSEIRAVEANDHWALDLNNLEKGWITKPSLPGPGRTHVSVASIGDWVYLFGGVVHHDILHGDDLKLVYAYNTVTDEWQRKTDLPIALSHCEGTSLAVEGYVLIIGGRCNTQSRNFVHYVRNTVFLYDPNMDEWSELKRFPTPIFGGAGGYFQNIKVKGVLGNYMIVTGGEYRKMLYDVRASRVSIKCNSS